MKRRILFIDTVPTIIIYIIIALIFTYPLISSFYTAIPGHGGDGYQFLWNYWWFKKALFNSNLSIFSTDYALYPVGISLVLHTFVPFNSFLMLLLVPIFGVIGGFNFVYILSIVVAAYGMFLLAKYVSGSREGAFVAGIIYGFTPYLFAHSLGHFNLTNIEWIPLYIYSLFRLRDEPTIPNVLLASLFLSITAYTDYGYMVFLLIFTLMFVLYPITSISFYRREVSGKGRYAKLLKVVLITFLSLSMLAVVLILYLKGFVIFVPQIKILSSSYSRTFSNVVIRASSIDTPLTIFWFSLLFFMLFVYGLRVSIVYLRLNLDRDFLLNLFKVAVIFAVAFSPVIVRGILLIVRGDYVAPPVAWKSGLLGADLISFFHPSFLHPLLGGYISRAYELLHIQRYMPVSESVVYLGITPLVLIIISKMWRYEEAKFWVFSGIAFFLFSLGPSLLMFGQVTMLPLPYAFLRYIPILNNVRVPSRFVVIAVLSIAILASLSVKLILEYKSSRSKIVILLIVSGLILFEFYVPPMAIKEVSAPNYYTEIVKEDGDFTILELPFYVRDGFKVIGSGSEDILYYQTIHGKRISNGYFSRVPERVFNYYKGDLFFGSLLKAQNGEPVVDEETMSSLKENSGQILEKNNFKYVSVKESVNAQLKLFIKEVFSLEEVARDKGMILYKIL